jgi:uncharacterized membrane protein (UPF0127 family)
MSRAPHFLTPLLQRRGSAGFALFVEGREEPVAINVQTAFDSGSRKKGLLGRTGMSDEEALVIAPCNAVHTFKMQFAIDVIYAARDGRIVKVRSNLRPGRISAALGAFATIEMAAGAIGRAALHPGDRLVIR